MDKLRSGEFTRQTVSFLLAVGLHALLFLIQGSGYWGTGGDGPRYILVQPRVIEIEPVRQGVEKEGQKAASTQKLATTTVKTPPAQEKVAPPAGEKPFTAIEEIHQEKPAPRETRTEPGEFATQVEVAENSEKAPREAGTTLEGTAGAIQGDALAEGEAETTEPAEPALPTLGAARGMALSFPQRSSYPKNAQNLGLEGRVLVEFYLTPEGTFLREPVILVPSGHQILDDYCRQMITKGEWRFKQAAQSYKVQVEISFVNNEVKIDFLGEAAYLSTEEGGD